MTASDHEINMFELKVREVQALESLSSTLSGFDRYLEPLKVALEDIARGIPENETLRVAEAMEELVEKKPLKKRKGGKGKTA